jgi:hypothetical protein
MEHELAVNLIFGSVTATWLLMIGWTVIGWLRHGLWGSR